MPSPEDTPVIDAALVRRLIAAQFPAWSGLPVTPVEPGGWDNRSFRLGADMLVRLPSAAHYVPQIEKEQRWLPRLAPHLPLPIPVPLALGKPGEDYPWPWSVYRWLDGEPAARHRIADPIRFAGALAAFLTALYRIDAAEGPPAGQHNFHRGGSLDVYDDETRAALAALGDRIDRSAAEAVWDAALTSRWERRPVCEPARGRGFVARRRGGAGGLSSCGRSITGLAPAYCDAAQPSVLTSTSDKNSITVSPR
jgi:aminoglycoside phosphotransferase (APT) family kinase protein